MRSPGGRRRGTSAEWNCTQRSVQRDQRTNAISSTATAANTTKNANTESASAVVDVEFRGVGGSEYDCGAAESVTRGVTLAR